MIKSKSMLRFFRKWICWSLPRLLLLARWLLLDISGIRFVFEKIHPPLPNDAKHRPAPSAGIWFLGIYFAAFGVAAQRYENAVDRIEARANGIYAQLGTGNYLQALERVPDAQHMTRPQKPALSSPLSIYCSLFGGQECDAEISMCLRDIVVSLKNDLSGVNLRLAELHHAKLNSANLSGADLSGATLVETDFREAQLVGANFGKPVNILADFRKPSPVIPRHLNKTFSTPGLSESVVKIQNFRDLMGKEIKVICQPTKQPAADLTKANLRWAILTGANLSGSKLCQADLGNSILRWADLRNVDFHLAKLNGADLSGANLSGAINLTQRQIDSACANPANLPVMDKGFNPPLSCDAEERKEARLLQSLGVFEKQKNRNLMSRVLLRLGALYGDRGDIIKAEEYFLKALGIYEKLRDEEGMASSNACLGFANMMLGRPIEAVKRYLASQAIYEKQGNKKMGAKNIVALATIYCSLGDDVKAEEYLNHLVNLEGLNGDNMPKVFNNMAWVYATSPDPLIRNGQRALELAKKATLRPSGNNAAYINTLAAAYASIGDFYNAIETQKKALEKLEDESQKDLYEEQLASYISDIPWREPAEKGDAQQTPK